MKEKELHTRAEPESPSEAEAPEFLEIYSGDKVIAKAPCIVETSGMGPCIGIFVYEGEIKEVIAQHFAHPDDTVQIPELAEFLDEAAARYPERQTVRVWVGGGAPDEEDFENTEAYDVLQQKRTLVTRSLEERGFQREQITVRWTDSSAENTVMRLDLSTGEMEYRNVEEDEPA